MTTSPPPEIVLQWRDYAQRSVASPSWSERCRAIDARRTVVRPEMNVLLERFLAGAASLEELRLTFDQRTRRDWDVFGAKGPNGAMFLNMLVKNLPDPAHTTSELKAVLRAPDDETSARARLAAFRDYLAACIASGGASAGDIHPARAPFLVSVWWHVQRPSDWPAFYPTARTALEEDGLYEPSSDWVESYLLFRRAFVGLAGAVERSTWELEHVCNWRVTEGTALPTPPPLPPAEKRRVWLIAPGPGAMHWAKAQKEKNITIGWGHLGDLSAYPTYEALLQRLQKDHPDGRVPFNDALACWQFAREVRVGDVVVAKKGRKLVLGWGTVVGGYRFEAARGEYAHVVDVSWQVAKEVAPGDRVLVTKTLTEISQYPGLVDEIRAALGVPPEPTSGQAPDGGGDAAPAYGLDQAEAELFAPRAFLQECLDLLDAKKNLVLTGPPGVGKTFLATRLAYAWIGGEDEERVERVQFHQSYGYEDFVQGFRPTESGGFRREPGPFLRFCERALQDQDQRHVIIIDEINRGNLSKILGELMMLLEADKRGPGWAVRLAYSREGEGRFFVPPNLYVIGTMNTADRSLALVDYALRRRFAFLDVLPAFDQPRFRQHLASRGVPPALCEAIPRRLGDLNRAIETDGALGTGFRIGHSYFCGGPGLLGEPWYRRIVRTEIAPLLREYWYDRPPDHVDRAVAALLAD